MNAQANFAYATPANDAVGLPLSLSIYAGRAHLRGTIRDDAEAAGFRVAEQAELSALLEGEAKPLGEVPDLPQTRAMLMRACDVRLPTRLTEAELDYIATAILDAVADVRG